MIAAIILAAGRSTRMGQPKMLLPWGKLTVIEHVVTTFLNAGITDIVVITGAAHEELKNRIQPYPVRTVYNDEHHKGEMLSSLQAGLKSMTADAQAALVALGDQPQIQERTIHLVRDAYQSGSAVLVVPSFQRRRGHPWLTARPFWDEILAMSSPLSSRDFLNRHSTDIQYVNVDNSSILEDLDTPEDYQKFRP